MKGALGHPGKSREVNEFPIDRWIFQKPLDPVTDPPNREVMTRRRAQVIQPDVARVLRAAKQAGAAEVEVKVGDHVMIVRFAPSTEQFSPLAPSEGIVL